MSETRSTILIPAFGQYFDFLRLLVSRRTSSTPSNSEHIRAQGEITLIGGKAELMIGLHRVIA